MLDSGYWMYISIFMFYDFVKSHETDEVVMFYPASSNQYHLNNTSHPIVAESLGKKIPKRLNQG